MVVDPVKNNAMSTVKNLQDLIFSKKMNGLSQGLLAIWEQTLQMGHHHFPFWNIISLCQGHCCVENLFLKDPVKKSSGHKDLRKWGNVFFLRRLSLSDNSKSKPIIMIIISLKKVILLQTQVDFAW